MSRKPANSQVPQKPKGKHQDQQTRRSTPTQKTIKRPTTSPTVSTSFMAGATRCVLDGIDMRTVAGESGAFEVGNSYKPQGRDDFFKDAPEALRRIPKDSSPNLASAPTATV
ncbi:hypothetical protein K435DRAFT_409197, partial [Dendrothele bispora CBS 962.96]